MSDQPPDQLLDQPPDHPPDQLLDHPDHPMSGYYKQCGKASLDFLVCSLSDAILGKLGLVVPFISNLASLFPKYPGPSSLEALHGKFIIVGLEHEEQLDNLLNSIRTDVDGNKLYRNSNSQKLKEEQLKKINPKVAEDFKSFQHRQYILINNLGTIKVISFIKENGTCYAIISLVKSNKKRTNEEVSSSAIDKPGKMKWNIYQDGRDLHVQTPYYTRTDALSTVTFPWSRWSRDRI